MLEQARNVRDCAPFDLAIDSKLRGCDLVKVKVGDPAAWCGRLAIGLPPMSTRPSQSAPGAAHDVELKHQLSVILSLEETDFEVDWPAVAAKARELLNHSADLPQIAVHYLIEVYRRQSDPVFAHARRAKLLSFLRAPSQGEHSP